MEESPGSKRRRTVALVAITVGVLGAGGFVVYGLSGSDGDSPITPTGPSITPTIGIIQAPAQVDSTRPVVQGSTPATADIPPPVGTNDIVVPPGTADIALPPVSADILTP
jgi:hypothetical protein